MEGVSPTNAPSISMSAPGEWSQRLRMLVRRVEAELWYLRTVLRYPAEAWHSARKFDSGFPPVIPWHSSLASFRETLHKFSIHSLID